ncbi:MULTISPECIES: hypothetical protein [Yersinia pseudotuberculosis complex]|uniref:Uncharacterized protein n=2 Tax=Yersinia pseudotuberculosis complex TaxID=1649845 RepID=A0A0T9PTC0_9GAMM|nr:MULTISPECIES: hypothetical protein [Yersinia pseudotuberculosis complex]ABS49152.1 hypothetical protein YpsIP31758_2214 [Yersinia pseudotuberculosis IP 31758]AJK17803.1 hypothetical protein BZ19_1213 [Yersinia pseudotuberculosis str. PA3606]MCE4113782.1 hypothetical protein [Yersinia pseudotuberculosis]MCF1165028.1 hypothetical protein [Yersinia pseudotuberculosis]RYC28109.1 hypothetical protein EU971_01390 [Yersinia pseudotuberculosis]
MARRKELVGVTHGIIRSFNNRNNDINGYWAIGQLKSFAALNGLASITFNLLPIEPAFNIELINKVTKNYSAKLYSLLISQRIPVGWIQNAAIVIQFSGVTPSLSEVNRCSFGEFYHCSCEVIDDNGKSYIASDYGFCLPHSPHKELKRFTR